MYVALTEWNDVNFSTIIMQTHISKLKMSPDFISYVKLDRYNEIN